MDHYSSVSLLWKRGKTEGEFLNLLVNLISIPHLAMSFWVVTEQNMKPGFTTALNSECVAHRV